MSQNSAQGGGIGSPGPRGATGPTGPVGPIGIQGPTGSVGPQGLQGILGPTGSIGAQGIQGPTGPLGPTGSIGTIGPVGPTGSIGGVGPAGPTGTIGATGPLGVSPCYGQLFVDGGSTAVSLPAASTYVKLTQWTTSNLSLATTPSVANSNIVVNTTATFECNVQISASMAASANYNYAIFVNGSRNTAITGWVNAVLATNMTISLSGLLALNSGDIVDVRVSTSNIGGTTVSLTNGNFSLEATSAAMGATGAIGPTGSVGTPGVAGPTGQRGATGAIGPTGSIGTPGITGPTGQRGATGAVGATGSGGIPGGSINTVQVNNGAGALNGTTDFTFVPATGQASISGLTVATILNVGPAPTTTATVNLTAAATISGSKTGGVGDINMLSMDTSNRVSIGAQAGIGDYIYITPQGGDGGLSTTGQMVYDTGSGQPHLFQNAGTTYFTVSSAAITSRAPMTGDANVGLYGAVDGTATIAMGNVNHTMAVSEYANRVIIFTGVNTVARTATFPLPTAGTTYTRVIWGQTTTAGVIISCGSGTTITTAVSDAPRTVMFSSTGVVKFVL